ncbi:MAG: arylsulfotransferase family protein [Solirubrobacteraceae bacterium]
MVGSLALTAPAQAAPIGAFTTRGAWKFVSAPGLHPPKLKVESRKPGLAGGDFLVASLPSVGTPGKMTGEGGPIIFDNKLRPVWFHGVGTQVGAADLQQETFMGQPVLLWWEGVVNSTGATTKGKLIVVNQHYQTIGTLTARSPWVISLHDASIVPGTPNVWVTAYRKVKNQPLGGGRRGTVYDVGLQEYNLKTGKLIKTWDALNPGHKARVPLSQSEQPPPSRSDVRHGAIWDAYHLNSAQLLPNGQLLVSMRNTWAVYLINPQTNKIIWTLGGKHSFFNFAKNAHFAWQHHAVMLSNGDVTLFNDNCTVNSRGLDCVGGRPSTGMVLHLKLATRKATLVKAFHHDQNLHTAFLGSMQLLGNGGAVIGWGSLPFFSEYSRTGKQLLNVKWPGKDETYRALYTGNWVGTPSYPPSGAVKGSKVYASWNGATTVAKWQVLAGGSSNHLKVVGSKARSGFETVITLSKSYRVYEVQALDSQGHVLKTSKTFS